MLACQAPINFGGHESWKFNQFNKCVTAALVSLIRSRLNYQRDWLNYCSTSRPTTLLLAAAVVVNKHL